jgi:hypothetical protein
MPLPILFIPDAVIGKSRLPNLSMALQFSFSAKRKTALNELHRFFDRLGWSDEQMQMVGHDDIGVQPVTGPVIMFQRVNHQPCRTLNLKERPASRRLRRDEIGVFVAPSCLPRGTHLIPSGAKAPAVHAILMYGLKPVPFT